MATFEEGTWVWMPDPEEQALPAKVSLQTAGTLAWGSSAEVFILINCAGITRRRPGAQAAHAAVFRTFAEQHFSYA